MKNLSKYKKILYAEIIGIALMIVGTAFLAQKLVAINQESTRLEKIYNHNNSEKKRLKTEYGDKTVNTQNKAYHQGINNSNKTVSTISNINSKFNDIDNIAMKYFREYYTWSDSSSYNSRLKRTKRYITDDVAGSGKLYSTATDTTGQSMVDTLKLTSDFNGMYIYVEPDKSDDSSTTAIVDVSYSSSEEGAQPKSMDRFFRVKYDNNKEKFVTIDPLFLVKPQQN